MNWNSHQDVERMLKKGKIKYKKISRRREILIREVKESTSCRTGEIRGGTEEYDE